MDAPESPLVIIAGPTGSGKSELALALAVRFAGEIVNSDSVQVYRFFDLGSAKLPLAERRGIPHHLLDVAAPGEVFSAGDYARLARLAIRGITARRRLPIVAGGTGFYLRALLDGLVEAPGRDEKLRRRLVRLEQRTPGWLHQTLFRRDPAAAGRIHPRDSNKLLRAIEIMVAEQVPLSRVFSRPRDPLQGYRILKIGISPSRADLYTRIEQRARLMFSRGLIDEVRAILARGYTGEGKPFDALGYAQALAVVEGSMTIEQAIVETQQATRRYAKRQWTWFRRQHELEWFEGFGDEAGVEASVAARVAEFLGRAESRAGSQAPSH